MAKRDRLGRDVLNVCLIQKLVGRKGAQIVSAAGEGSDDDGPTSILMRQIVDAFGQYERALNSGANARGPRGQEGTRRTVGGIPFGYQPPATA